MLMYFYYCLRRHPLLEQFCVSSIGYFQLTHALYIKNHQSFNFHYCCLLWNYDGFLIET